MATFDAGTRRRLQIWHVSALALVPLLYALLRLASEPHDDDRALIDGLFILGGAAWSAVVAVWFVVTGKSDEALPSLLRLYRGLLAEASWFVLVANIVLSVLVAVFAFKLVGWRPVEFVGSADVELLLNDEVGQIEFVGFVRARTPMSYRLRVGTRKLVVREAGTDQVIDQRSIEVPSMLSRPGRVRVFLDTKQGVKYEKAG